MHDDDHTIGRILSRRQALSLLGACGGGLLAGVAGAAPSAWMLGGRADASPWVAQSVPGCVVRPEQTEGPYYVDRQLERSDIRAEPSTGALAAGVPLALTFTVSRVSAGGCAPLPGAIVNVWQCDALGVYSGVNDRIVGAETFLRGFQRTDSGGVARFTTIYPGWYRGRTVHIHFKIETAAPAGGHYEFTSQLYFDEALTDRVHAMAPYAARGRRDTLNRTDGIFRDGGDQLLLNVSERGGQHAAGCAIGLDLSDASVGRPDGSGAGGRGRGGPRRGGPVGA
jgi:protocatechuate 3,4-dioxygenase beta subunit